MIRECFRANTGIQFYRGSLESVGLNPDTLLDLRLPSPTPSPALVAEVEPVAHVAEPSDRTLVDLTEKSEEREDACSPIYDKLNKSKAWWILEVIPMSFREQILKKGHYKWKYYWKCVFISNTILSHSHGHGPPAD